MAVSQSKLAEVVMFLPHIWEVPDLNVDWDADYPE
jgi:hypothetical protein